MQSAHLVTLAGRDRDRIATLPFAILPVGSLEFHGDHAPFGTDTTLAEGFADAIAERRPCLVLPAVAYAFVPPLTRDHGPGVSVPPDVFLAYLTAVLCGAADAGIRRVLVVNGHSENQYALRLAAEQACERHRDLSVLLVNWWPWVDGAPDGEAARAFGEGGGHGHGGPLEISVTAAFDPAGVVPAPAEADIAYEAPWWRGRAQVVGLGQAPAGFAGYHGRVAQVDAAVGRRVAAQVADRLAELIDGWLERARGAADAADAAGVQAGAGTDRSDQLG
jgi:creatinine amidohydrolase